MKLNFICPLSITTILLLCTVFCQAQTMDMFVKTDTITTIDTVRVILLVGDTSHHYSKYMQFQSCEDVKCKDTTQKHKMYISHYEEIKEDKGNHGYGQSYWIYGYSVRRKECCVNGNTSDFSIYLPSPYYTHLFYLDDKKQPIKETLIVWQSVYVK